MQELARLGQRALGPAGDGVLGDSENERDVVEVRRTEAVD